MTAEPVGLIALVVDDEAPARSEVRYLLERISGADMRDWNSVKTRIREAVSAAGYTLTD